MIEFVSLACLSGLLNVCLPLPAAEEPQEQARLQGVWKVVAVEAAERRLHPQAREALQAPVLVAVKENQFCVFDADGYRDAWTFALQRNGNAFWVDLVDEEKNQHFRGIYALKGPRLTLCLSTRDGERPAGLVPAAGSHKVPSLLGAIDVPNEVRIELERVNLETLPRTEATRRELERFEGTWKLVKVEQEGQPLPAEEVNGLNVTVRIAHGKVRLHHRNQSHELGTILQVIPGDPFNALDMLMTDGPFENLPHPAIYSLQGDLLKVRFGDEDNGKRPLDFATQAGDRDAMVFTLQRVKE
jgi:uncharacterized protein (TIGR03067 family)